MTLSQQTPFLSDLTHEEKIAPQHIAYVCERVRNNFYDYVMHKFLEAESTRGLTKAALARRLGKGADRISKALASPGNWTLDTATEFLVAICGEELLPHSERILGRSIRNHTQEDHLKSCFATGTKSGNAYILVGKNEFPITSKRSAIVEMVP